MAKASASAPLASPVAEVLGRVTDYAAWTAWMPGVDAVRLLGDDDVEWTVMGAPIALRMSRVGDAVSFEGAGGPFTAVAGRVAVGNGACTVEMLLEGAPVPVDPLVQEAVAKLAGTVLEPELLAVPMSDGATLAVHHYRCGTEPAPAVVIAIPYRKDSAFLPLLGGLLTRAGMDVLVADVRGFGGSVAPYEGLFSEREIQDGVELIEWASSRPWCTGRVGLAGASYCGINQLLFASRKPKGLACITPVVGPVDTYRDMWHRGGMPSHTHWGAMTYLRSQHVETARKGLAEFYLDNVLDPFDNARHRHVELADIDVPALAVGGFNDYFLRGTVRTFQQVSGPKSLVIGPWGHGDADPSEIVTWLQHWLSGATSQPPGPRVRLYVGGADEWIERDDWVDTSSTDFHRWQPLGALTPVPVRTHEGAVAMAPNVRPHFNPDPTDSGMSSWGEDVTFDSDPFTDARIVLGPIGLALSMAVDGVDDVDVRARVSVVGADGTVTQLTEGRLRASHRAVDVSRSQLSSDGEIVVPWHPHDASEPLPPRQPFVLNIEVDPLCHRFAAGDRLRLGLNISRADEGVVPAEALLGPDTFVLVP